MSVLVESSVSAPVSDPSVSASALPGSVSDGSVCPSMSVLVECSGLGVECSGLGSADGSADATSAGLLVLVGLSDPSNIRKISGACVLAKPPTTLPTKRPVVNAPMASVLLARMVARRSLETS